METSETLKLISTPEFLDSIYHYAYHRCNSSHEAEDLCSDIILEVISAVNKTDKVDNFYAFVFTVAHRVYSDFCGKRKVASRNVSIDSFNVNADNGYGETFDIPSRENEIEDFIERSEDLENLRKIMTEIHFLSKAYRDVVVMYYIDEYKVKEIAVKLGVSETTVKQRLFSARKTIKKEVETMDNRNLSLKPIDIWYVGTGNPLSGDPSELMYRTLSKNLVYLCKDKPMTAKELSDALCVPMIYIEEELAIQCEGKNGYGALKKLDNGKYVTNILMADSDEYYAARAIYEKHLPKLCETLKGNIEKSKEKILSFPYLSAQTDTRFILWTLISPSIWKYSDKVSDILCKKYFADVKITERPFYSCGVVSKHGENLLSEREETTPSGFYGCDGIEGTNIGGYRHIQISNVYGPRIDSHFHCGHNISTDPNIIMLLMSIGGLPIDKLEESYKEAAAKAIECGYLRKNGNILEPNIIVIKSSDIDEFNNISSALTSGIDEIAEETAKELASFMKEHIPERLIGEYHIYNQCIAASALVANVIEECIKKDILTVPKKINASEGIIMKVWE